MDWIFTARERLTPDTSDRWLDYIHWIGFTHIEELITLDSILCLDRIDELVPIDWLHNVPADRFITWFRDLDYLRQRLEWRRGRDQIMAAIADPQSHHEPPNGFISAGFDVLDGYDSISLLTNCGQFPDIIDPTRVNRYGLIPDLATAQTIADRLRREFPEDAHCKECRVWQIARDADLREPGSRDFE